MIYLITDFGSDGPYLGQLKAVLYHTAPAMPVINLLANAPVCDPVRSAYLVPAYSLQALPGDVVLGVVDPGVGGQRAGIVLEADGIWYIGPDNGLFSIVASRAAECRWWMLPPPGPTVSATFHGRDWFAPYAARLATGEWRPSGESSDSPPSGEVDPDDSLAEVIYIDHYGNLVTGVPGSGVTQDCKLAIGGRHLDHARYFSVVDEGRLFWYTNANDLIEIAANRARASDLLTAFIGMPVHFGSSESGLLL